MPQRGNSLENNCIQIMNSVIKNLEPSTFQNLLEEVLSLSVNNNKKEIEKYIRKKLKLTSKSSKRSTNYWVLRGWNKDQAYVKSKEHKQKNCKSVYSRNYWLEKINPTTGNLYTIEEADFERNSRRPIKKEYWIKKGYLDLEAQKLSKEVKNHNNKKGAHQSASSNIRRVTSKRCVDYYTARGYSAEDAKDLVSQVQKYFSKKICTEKYGEEKGFKIWKERQERWQKTLNSKPIEEITRINRLKAFSGGAISLAEKEILNEIKKFNSDLLVVSQLALSNNEKQYLYDISANKKIIEYNGDFWHSNPLKYSADYINPRTKIKASDKWKIDQEKINFAQSLGYEVLVIWEHDYKTDKEKVLKKCIQFLTQ